MSTLSPGFHQGREDSHCVDALMLGVGPSSSPSIGSG